MFMRVYYIFKICTAAFLFVIVGQNYHLGIVTSVTVTEDGAPDLLKIILGVHNSSTVTEAAGLTTTTRRSDVMFVHPIFAAAPNFVTSVWSNVKRSTKVSNLVACTREKEIEDGNHSHGLSCIHFAL